MSKKSYPCVFDAETPCPVRCEFMLKPESLVEFCKCCKLENKLENQKMVEMFSNLAPHLIDRLTTQRHESPLEITKNFLEMAKMLGFKQQEDTTSNLQEGMEKLKFLQTLPTLTTPTIKPSKIKE